MPHPRYTPRGHSGPLPGRSRKEFHSWMSEVAGADIAGIFHPEICREMRGLPQRLLAADGVQPRLPGNRVDFCRCVPLSLPPRGAGRIGSSEVAFDALHEPGRPLSPPGPWLRGLEQNMVHVTLVHCCSAQHRHRLFRSAASPGSANCDQGVSWSTGVMATFGWISRGPCKVSNA